MAQLEEADKLAIDVAAISAWIAALAGWLPAVAALFSIVWTAIRIWETKTVQAIIKRWQKRDE